MSKGKDADVAPPPGSATPERWTPGTDGQLQERIRTGSEKFRFNALIDGVSTLDRDVPPEVAVVRSRPGRARRSFMVLSILVALVAGGYFVAGKITSGTAERQLPAAVADDRDLTPSERLGLPNPRVTPGERIQGLLNRDSVDPQARRDVFALYGKDENDPKLVLARVIPLELDGTSGVKNLFPTTRWFAELKSRLDRRLTAEVQSGKLTIEEAHALLAENWIRASHQYGLRNFGETDPDKVRAKEAEAKHW